MELFPRFIEMFGRGPGRRRVIRGLALMAASCGAACSRDGITGPRLPDQPLAATSLAVGLLSSCALTADGQAFCWGDDRSGELGDSTFAIQLAPVPVKSTQRFIAIYSGNATTCALDHAGAAWCWGDDPTQPGVALSFQYVPSRVAAPRAFTSLVVGRKYACGLDAGGTAYCWGENGRGQLGVGDTVEHAAPMPVNGGLRFQSLAGGFWSTCGLTTAGDAYCWGDNAFDELGTGDTLSESVPRKVVGGVKFVSLSGGATHECGLTAAGAAYCWGSNLSGQLGDGTNLPRLVPTPVVGGLAFTALRSHRGNSVFAATCGTVAGGDLYCWGSNEFGQLGVPTASTVDGCLDGARPRGAVNGPGVILNECSFRPIKVPGVSRVLAFDVGGQHTCALTSQTVLLCWGQNTSGQLGDGTGVDRSTPAPIAGTFEFP